MTKAVVDYFENTIMSIIRKRHSELIQEMSIMILGSVGLGIDDELSDIEAAIYLDDPVWKKSGGQLQLTLNDCLSATNLWKREGSVISVYPLSWLLDGQAKRFLNSEDDLPWEKVSYETFFTIQNNLIFYDPQNTLSRLREVASPSLYPERLWKKSLIEKLKLIVEDLSELKLCIIRKRIAEAHIVLGHVIEGLFHIGFLILHQYYPWRTHLRWAFDKLPLPISDLGSEIYLLLTSVDWDKKIEIIETIIAIYKDYILSNEIIPEINIQSSDINEELVWAERLQAWESPNWRNWITNCTNRAVESGYAPDQFWVWSFWGWVNDEPKKSKDS